jgi:MtN3 and saliva related transmembrane protein
MPSSELIGYLAAALTTASFIPQALLTWRTRRADGVSLGMYCILTGGIALWLVYGLQIQAMPVIAANCVTLILTSFILIMKIKCK